MSRNKYWKKLFYSYVSIILLGTIIIGVMVFLLSYEKTKSFYYSKHVADAKFVKNYMEGILNSEEILSSYMEIVQDNNITAIISNKEEKIKTGELGYTAYEIWDMLKGHEYKNSDIYSIDVYWPFHNIFIGSRQGLKYLSSMPLKEAENIMAYDKIDINSMPYITTVKTNKKEYIRIMRPIPVTAKNNDIKAIVVCEYEYEKIYNEIRANGLSEYSSFFVINSKNFLPGNNKNIQITKKVKNSSYNADVYHIIINGSKALLSVIPSDYYSYSYCFVTKTDGLNSSIIEMGKKVGIYCSIAIILLIVLAHIIAKKIYLPVYNLFGVVKEALTEKNNDGRSIDEINAIKMHVENMKKINESLNKVIKENKALLKMSNNYSLFETENVDEEENYIPDIMETHKLEFKLPCYMLLAVYCQDIIWKTGEEFSARVQKGSRIIEDIEEYLNKETRCAGIDADLVNGKIIFIINFEKDFHIRKAIDKLHQHINEKNGDYATLVISNIYNDILNTSEILKKFSSLEYYIYIKGKKKVISIEKKGLVLPYKDTDWIYRLTQVMINQVRFGNEKKVEETVDNIVESIRHIGNDVKLIKSVTAYFIIALHGIAREMGLEEMQNIQILMDEFNRINTLDGFKKFLLKKNLDIVKMNNLKKTDDRKQLLFEIVNYIRENIQDISLQVISDKFKMHPSYISRMFASELGINYSEIIKEIKLEKACLMLKDTKYSIEEIAEELGYGSGKYLSLVFKKRFGLSPREYRCRLAQGEIEFEELIYNKSIIKHFKNYQEKLKNKDDQ